MRATGRTSAERGPDDPADGLHPVLHVPLGAGHEQERLGVGRHLLPLPGTTCKTGRTGLLQGPQRTRGASPIGLSPVPTTAGFHSLGCEKVVSPKTTQQQLCFLVLYWQATPFPHPTSHIWLWGPLGFLLLPLSSLLFLHSIKIILGY